MTSAKRLLGVSLSLALLSYCQSASAQVTLNPTSGSYSENFDGIGAGLPTGWTVRTGANATSLGTELAVGTNLVLTPTAWATTNGRFNNYASASGLSESATTTEQSDSTNRALGIRQSGSFGDPGAAFTLEIANTTDLTITGISFSAEMLSVQARSTTWSIQYGIGATPTTFTTLGTYTDPGVFGATPLSFTADLAPISEINDTVWLRVVALSNSTGGGSRDSFGINDFVITYQPIPEPATVLGASAMAAGAFALVRRRRKLAAN